MFKEKQLQKYFKTGDHVKVIAGNHEGATGMIVKNQNNVVTILSDTTREDVSSLVLYYFGPMISGVFYICLKICTYLPVPSGCMVGPLKCLISELVGLENLIVSRVL